MAQEGARGGDAGRGRRRGRGAGARVCGRKRLGPRVERAELGGEELGAQGGKPRESGGPWGGRGAGRGRGRGGRSRRTRGAARAGGPRGTRRPAHALQQPRGSCRAHGAATAGAGGAGPESGVRARGSAHVGIGGAGMRAPALLPPTLLTCCGWLLAPVSASCDPCSACASARVLPPGRGARLAPAARPSRVQARGTGRARGPSPAGVRSGVGNGVGDEVVWGAPGPFPAGQS